MNDTLNNEQINYVNQIWDKVKEKVSAECDRNGSLIPYIPVDGKYEDMGKSNVNWWTNGFWSGILWQMFHGTGDVKYKDIAEQVEIRLDEALNNYNLLDHDVGFIWLCASVANYKTTGSRESKKRGLVAASILSSRYNVQGEFIRAWNGEGSPSIIIDCLMNLPLLYWASEEEKDPRFYFIGKNHTNTTLKYIVRKDGSCNHIVELNPNTGEFVNNPGGQGYAQGSSWSRGHAWAIYGMALAYKYLGEQECLDAAKNVAHYFIANISLTDYVPLIDFRSPKEPIYYDTTAGACAACGLLELSKYVDEYERELYIQNAFKILKALDEKHCDYSLEIDGILGYGSARYDREIDRHVPIIYGDYFLIELVLRFLDKDFPIW